MFIFSVEAESREVGEGPFKESKKVQKAGWSSGLWVLGDFNFILSLFLSLQMSTVTLYESLKASWALVAHTMGTIALLYHTGIL